ncbi:MAG: hypothetical protein EA340_06760 [Nitriliruptor sp.]|nr:MAG: hypothetical protein EA340_06760 [Nitriliruptor sp.]TVR22222.1 MAG: hypothetical protein EA387_09020 [Nitriliruptor sp.]
MDAPADADPLYLIRLQREELFRHDVEFVWRWMSATDRFPTWWRWLREFESEGGGLVSGGMLRGLVVPPIPYRFRVGIHFDEVEPAQHITARLSGDLHGPADVSLVPHGTGTRLTIRWHVEMRKPSMRAAARYAKGLMVWGHDQVIDITVRRFHEVLDRAEHAALHDPSDRMG